MAGIDGYAIWHLADAIRSAMPAHQQPDRTTARLSYVDGDGVPWYRIDGSSIDTPCVGGSVAEVQPGEQVEVEIRGGMLYVLGNDDSPSVGEGRVTSIANSIVEPVRVRVVQAIEENAVTKAIADAAKRVADAIDQHFWTDTNGVHVTHVTQEDWESSHSGPNVLINSIGQLFRDGLNNLISITTENNARSISFFDGLGNEATNIIAYFGSSGARIGSSLFSHVLVESGAVKVKKNTDVIAHMGFVDGDTVASSLSGDAAIGTPYTLPADFVTLTSVNLNGNTLSASDYTISDGLLTLNQTQNVQDIFDASVDEDGNVIPVYLSVVFVRSDGIALTVGGTQAVRPGFESFEQARFSHPSSVLAQHSAASTNAGFRAKRADSTGDVMFIVGSGGVNHGIWSNTLGKWLLHGDNSRMYLNGGRIGLTNNGFEAAGVSSLTFITPNHDSSNITHWRMMLTEYGNLRLDSSTDNKATWTTVGYYRRTDQGGTFPDTVTIDSHSLITTTGLIQDATTVSNDTGGTGVYLRNANDHNLGYVRGFARGGSDRERGIQVLGTSDESTTTFNGLYLLVDKDGNRVVRVTESKPWRDAINPSPLVTETPSAVSVATSSWSTLGSITVTQGIWVFSISTTFDNNSSGRRAVYFGTSSTGTSITVGTMGGSIMAPAVGDKTKYSSCHIGQVSVSTTYYCRAWQNSGSSLSCQCYLRAVRIV